MCELEMCQATHWAHHVAAERRRTEERAKKVRKKSHKSGKQNQAPGCNQHFTLAAKDFSCSYA